MLSLQLQTDLTLRQFILFIFTNSCHHFNSEVGTFIVLSGNKFPQYLVSGTFLMYRNLLALLLCTERN